MKEFQLQRTQVVPVSLEAAFAFFSDARNLEVLTPPWLNFSIVSCPPTLIAGSLIDYRMRIHGVPVRWRTLIEEWVPGVSFVDLQVRGPYRLWRHEHTFKEVRDGVEIKDHVRYALPFGPFGALAEPLLVRRDLKVIFDYRNEQISRLLLPAQPTPDHP